MKNENETETRPKAKARSTAQIALDAFCKLGQYEDIDEFVDLLCSQNQRRARDLREALTVANEEGRVD